MQAAILDNYHDGTVKKIAKCVCQCKNRAMYMFFIKIYNIKVINDAYVLIDAFWLRLPTFIERLFNHI